MTKPLFFALATSLALGLTAPAFAQSSVLSTYGNLSVYIAGNGSLGSTQTANGIEARLNDHLVIIGPDTVTVDGVVHPITAQSSINIDGMDGFVVTVDGTELGAVAEIDPELAQIMADAEAGIPGAQNNLANRYFFGRGVEQDYDRANELYALAVAAGLAEAQSNLAYSYWNGEGVENDDAEAMRLAALAADQDNAIGIRLLALGTYHGRGVAQDKARAALLWSTAANMGDATSAYNMGIIVRDGDGVLQDTALAILWFERAESLGHERAAERLEELRAQ